MVELIGWGLVKVAARDVAKERFVENGNR